MTYMKRWLFLLVMFCMAGAVQAQTTVSGRVLDQSNSQPMPFATVAVLNQDSTVLTGAVTDNKGEYAIGVKNQGEYILAVSFIGYETAYRKVTVGKSPVEMEAIVLSPDATMLQAVKVVERAPVVEQQMDKLVMNVAQSAFAQGSNAMDLLRKAPGVSVDKDGNVLLNGQAVAVWIDGRPSNLDGKSLEMLLRGTDGSNIEKIEIMANPSAKYDAEGQGGIINIKTTHHFAQGLNGSVSADVAGMWFDREMKVRAKRTQFFFDHNLNARVNFRTEKTNTFVHLSESGDAMGVNLLTSTEAKMGGSVFEQQTGSQPNVQGRGFTLKVGNDWFIDKKNTVGVIFTMPINSMRQWDDASFSVQRMNGNLLQQSLSNPVTEYTLTQYMGNLNYTHVFDEAKASELTANLDYFHNITNSENSQTNWYFPLRDPLRWVAPYYDSTMHMALHTDNVIDIYSAKVDWQGLVAGSFMMEAGAKWALSHTDNLLTQTWGREYHGIDNLIIDSIRNPFDYTENVGAVYATAARQLSQRWSAKAGLRYEYTYAFNTTSTVKQSYGNLFPTLYVGYNTPDMMKRVGLTYTRRITRPNYMQLNPFRNYVDAHTSNMGNPNLKPSYSDNVSLTAGFGRYVTLTGNYIYTRDQLTIVPTFDPVTGDQVMMADNFGSTSLLGGGVTLSELPLGKLFSFTLNAYAYDFRSTEAHSTDRVVGHPGEPKMYDKHSFLGSLYACLTLVLPKDWKVQLDGFYSSPIVVGYLKTSSNEMVNLGVKKTALSGRLVLSLQVNDLLRTMSNSFDVVYADGVTSRYTQDYLFQKVKLGLQWNFGASQKPLRHRNVGTLEELDRASNSSGKIN